MSSESACIAPVWHSNLFRARSLPHIQSEEIPSSPTDSPLVRSVGLFPSKHWPGSQRRFLRRRKRRSSRTAAFSISSDALSNSSLACFLSASISRRISSTEGCDLPMGGSLRELQVRAEDDAGGTSTSSLCSLPYRQPRLACVHGVSNGSRLLQAGGVPRARPRP